MTIIRRRVGECSGAATGSLSHIRVVPVNQIHCVCTAACSIRTLGNGQLYGYIL